VASIFAEDRSRRRHRRVSLENQANFYDVTTGPTALLAASFEAARVGRPHRLGTPNATAIANGAAAPTQARRGQRHGVTAARWKWP